MLRCVFRPRYIGALSALVLVACSSGCMFEPGHGFYYNSRDVTIRFMGAVREFDMPVEIQAYHPRRGWEKVAETTSDMYYRDQNGVWYAWYADAQVPREYWRWNELRYELRLRAVNPFDGQPLYTFDQSFHWEHFLMPLGPEYLTMSHVDMWLRWGHGNEVTVYAHIFPELTEFDRGF